jgi:hypothetical protein
MTHFGLSLRVVLLVTLILLGACERQDAPKPVGAATNKHVEQAPTPLRSDAAEVMTETIKSPLDKARQTGEVLQGEADRTSKQAEQVTP